MATNNNGHPIDDAGNVVVDFVWGNIPLQPNDVRSTVLDYTADNHQIVTLGWNGYPLYTPNTDGSAVDSNSDGVIQSTEAFITVPKVLGKTTAIAVDLLKDAGFTTAAGVSTVTTATAADNTAKTVTAAARTSGSRNLVFTASGAGAAYAVDTQVTVSGFTGGNVALNGTYTVTDNATNTFTVYTTATTTVSLTGQSASVVGLTGTIKTQGIAAGNTSTLAGAAITITPWA
jgi:hypothetical protein